MGWNLLSYADKFNKNRTGNSRAVFGDDDAFWDRYKALNPQYQSQLQPYLYYNYKAGYKDFVRGMLGMRSNEDAVRETAAAQAWQMLASLENDSFQNDFNSAEEQAARAKDAGLNPDLSGQVEGDPAAQQEQPITPAAIDFLTPPSSYAQDLVSLFSNASQLISSASQFGNMVTGFAELPSKIGKNLSETDLNELKSAGEEISNLSQAKDVVDKFLSGIDPDVWKNYREGDTDNTEFNNLVKRGFQDLFGDAPELAKKYLDAALDRSLADPRIMQKYYESSNEVIPAVTKNIALKKAYLDGVDFPQWFIEKQNTYQLQWTKAAIDRQSAYISAFNGLNLIAATNASDLEAWRLHYKLPQLTSKAEYAEALTARTRAQVEQARLKAEKAWLSDLQNIRKNGTPEEQDAANYLIQAYFASQAAALQSSSGSGGGNLSIGDFSIGGNGSSSSTKPVHLPWSDPTK